MSARGRGAGLLIILACVALGACDQIAALTHRADFDTEKLEAALDPAIGGPDTCVIIDDVRSGAELYRYGSHAVCDRPLPPCGVFQPVMALIGLDEGQIAPAEVVPWDGAGVSGPAAWRRGADLASALQTGAPWWWARLARRIGPQRMDERLGALGYAQGHAAASPEGFWLGPASGGAMAISTAAEGGFLRRLFAGALPVRAASSAAVGGLMLDEARGQTRLSGAAASCASVADGSRGLGWWVGRIQSPMRDVAFAISVEGQNALPGAEIRSRTKPILTGVGLLPAR